MTVAVDQEKEMAEFGQDINPVNPTDYGCQILLEKTTLDAANDKSFPTDAKLIWYVESGTSTLILHGVLKLQSYLICTMISTVKVL